MGKYIGITIGPILDTLMEATSPASLWFVSSMFSDITRRLCKEILDSESFQGAHIYSPYYDNDVDLTDGVGKFHDRIIFYVSEYHDDTMRGMIEEVKKDTMGAFPAEFRNHEYDTFMEEYLQIHYIVIDESEMKAENCILQLSGYLDMLELMKSFPANNKNNPIRKLLASKENANKNVKESSLFRNINKESNQLINSNGKIFSIEEIAKGIRVKQSNEKANSGIKPDKYFAVIQADGDGMGACLKQLKDTELTSFSNVCLEYAGNASKMIGRFGGMTIYAGGDDLLALTPVVNSEGKSVFQLCNEINEMFVKLMKERGLVEGLERTPTISFGISIQYIKAPLYEALAQGRKQLFGRAKCTAEKNVCAINVQKHSGQSLELMISNDKYKAVLAKILELGQDQSVKTIHSIIYKLEAFYDLFVVLDQQAEHKELDYESYESAWLNLFDNKEQQVSESYIQMLCEIYYEEIRCDKCKISLREFISMLRLKKFLLEGGNKDAV